MKRKSLRLEQLENRQLMAVNVLSPLPDVLVPGTSAGQTVSLAGRFDDTAVTGTVVQFNTNSAAPHNKFFVELFDQSGAGRTRTTPQTAANFLRYADDGRYTNTILHRTVTGFVTQGGGFTQPTVASDQSGSAPAAIPTYPAVVNEPGNTNVRGTIAMAKLGNDANSATNQWFFNLGNNSANLDAQNGGFTAFGRVLGSGMGVVDSLAAIPTYNVDNGGVFKELPLRPVAGSQSDPRVIQPSQYVTMTSITRIGELVYTVTSGNPALVTASLDAGNVQLAYAPNRYGTTTITVRATSVFDAADFKEDVFTVTRNQPATTVALVAATDSGVSSSDRITNNTLPAFTGTAITKDAVVTLFAQRGSEPIVTLGTARASAATGAWAFATPRAKAFAAGEWKISATVTSLAGSESPRTDPLPIVVDTSTAAPTTIRLAAASDTGISSTDGITSVTRPTVTGVAEKNASVTVFAGNRPLGTARADAVTGAFSVTAYWSLPNGSYAVTAVAVDAAGNASSRSAALPIVIDTRIPFTFRPVLVASSDTGASNSDGRTAQTKPTFASYATPLSTVEVYAQKAGEAPVLLGTAKTNRNGVWLFTVPANKALAAGSYQITARALTEAVSDEGPFSSPLAIQVGAAFA